ncbi:hypothetical protein GJ744_006544 [Endocarpon pusillum]|uniref:Zn(2)-C6 fungal-type domain-containing protein n=1 Tax=Endocarpon pusillum TaxID=364733 RepID=A0A8H7AR32_9EURO|nr:hypothetical protein GJ744_006544 [Endocarpon pusillum]
MGKHNKRMNGAQGACSACRRRKVKCDDFEWPCANCLRRNERDLCSHPKASENLTEVLTRRLRRLEKENEELHRSKAQMEQEATERLTRTQQEKEALKHQIEELKHQTEELKHQIEELQISGHTVQTCIACPEDESQNAAETSNMFTGPDGQQRESLTKHSLNQLLHLPAVEPLSRQATHLPNADINIDFDKDGESNGFWTPLGQWEDQHMRGIRDTDPPNFRIDEQQGQFPSPFSLGYHGLPADKPCFDIMAESPGTEANHPHPECTLVADTWDNCRENRQLTTVSHPYSAMSTGNRYGPNTARRF